VNETADRKHDRALQMSARYFQETTGINLGIVFLRQLPPLTTIERHADELFTRLGLGRRTDGKALLFLWSEKERQFKIEVSYDLEGVFPDALCKRLEEGARTFMLSTSPYARRDFIVELNVTMKLRYLEYGKSSGIDTVAVPVQGPRYVGNYLAGGAGVVGRGYSSALEQVQNELKPLSPERARDLQPGRTPEETIERYLSSLELGIGDPGIPLLTEASRYFRMDKPHAPGYLQRIRAYIAKAGPYTLAQKDDLAVARYRLGAPVMPIFLRRDAHGLWRVDEPKAWATVHLFQDGSHRLKYLNAAYAFGIEHPPNYPKPWSLFMSKSIPPPLLPVGADLKAEVARAEAAVRAEPRNVEAWIALANLLHFEMFWLQPAEAVYERIVALAPERTDMRWRMIDIYQMTSDVEGQNREWCAILKRDPGDSLARWHYKWFRTSFYKEDPRTDVCRDRWGRRFDED
jgi:hypothetical protein